MHSRIHQPSLTNGPSSITTATIPVRAMNRIRLTGKMTLNLTHDWIQSMFPDVPPYIGEDESECIRLVFQHCFTHAVSTCEYKKNEVSLIH